MAKYKLWKAKKGDRFIVLNKYYPFYEEQLIEFIEPISSYDWCSNRSYVRGRAGKFKVISGYNKGEVIEGYFKKNTLRPHLPRPKGGFKRLINFKSRNGGDEALFRVGKGSRNG